jgi:hypothetical protein
MQLVPARGGQSFRIEGLPDWAVLAGAQAGPEYDPAQWSVADVRVKEARTRACQADVTLLAAAWDSQVRKALGFRFSLLCHTASAPHPPVFPFTEGCCPPPPGFSTPNFNIPFCSQGRQKPTLKNSKPPSTKPLRGELLRLAVL